MWRTNYDYDNWALYGGKEWSAEKIKSVFKKMENNSLDHVDDLETFLLYRI